jgi:hypothetical protein
MMQEQPSLAWSEEKNLRLQAARGLSFEAVREAIEQGRVLDELVHPNPERFGHQRILVVEIDGYACAVPYVIDGDTWFLKTIYRSRALQRKYMNKPKP